MLSRKDFIQLGGFTLAGLFVPGKPGLIHTLFNQNQWLLFDKERLPQIRRDFKSHPAFESLRKAYTTYDYNTVQHFLETDIHYNDQLYDIMAVCDVIEDMSFYYAMSGGKKAKDLAIVAIKTLMKFEKWDYFMEAHKYIIGLQRAPQATLTMSYGLEWLQDAVSPDQRREWMKITAKRGIEPCFRSIYGMRYPNRVVGWSFDPQSAYLKFRPGDTTENLSNWPHILNHTNLKAVPTTGLIVGAMAYENEFGKTKDTERWIEQGIYTYKTLGALYMPDGSYPEGVSYSNYTSIHVAESTDILKRKLGKNFFDMVDWKGYVKYLLEMSMPTYEDKSAVANFGDNVDNATAVVPFWVARQTGDQTSQWLGQTLADNRRETYLESGQIKIRLHHSSQDEVGVIWYDDKVKAVAPPQKPYLWKCDLDWIVGRTGYEIEDLVLAMRSGGPGNHEHADRNSIILKCYGEMLVADPLHSPYNFKDPSWMMRTTAGHSAILIDGHGHEYINGHEGTNSSKAHAKITEWKHMDNYMFWVSDATPAYQMVLPDVKSITRTVIMFPGSRAVILLDKVIKKEHPSDIQARFFVRSYYGRGKLEVNKNGFKTIRPHAWLHGFSRGSTAIHYINGRLPIPKEVADKHPFAEVQTSEKSMAPFLVTVLLPEHNNETNLKAEITKKGRDVYEVTIQSPSGKERCVITDKGPVPEFKI